MTDVGFSVTLLRLVYSKVLKGIEGFWGCHRCDCLIPLAVFPTMVIKSMRSWRFFLPFLLGFVLSLQTESMATVSVEREPSASASCFCWFKPTLTQGRAFHGISVRAEGSLGIKRRNACLEMMQGGNHPVSKGVRANMGHIRPFFSPGKRWIGGKLPTKTFASTISGGGIGLQQEAADVCSGVCTDGSDDEFHYPEGSTKFVAECELPTDRWSTVEGLICCMPTDLI
eukprot:762804-Hanusia_phi.AAC.4